jgi:hypothetical protein
VTWHTISFVDDPAELDAVLPSEDIVVGWLALARPSSTWEIAVSTAPCAGRWNEAAAAPATATTGSTGPTGLRGSSRRTSSE